MTALAAGVALLGSLFFALGAALQQHEAARSSTPRLRVLLRRPAWLAGAAASAAGATLHVVALSLGPLSVVQPMGVASLLFALPIASAMHGRSTGPGELAAACLVSVGLIGLVLLVPPSSQTPQLTNAAAVAMLVATGLAALACFGLAQYSAGAVRSALLALAAGVLYGATATFTHVVVGGTGDNLWLLAALPLPAVAALMLIQRAYAHPPRSAGGQRGSGHFGVAFATLQVADPLTAVTCGASLLGEPLPDHAAIAVVFALVAGAGIAVLARTTPLPT
ncbi:hypothetical protein GCM10023194_27750 [Planotetraspora phitsanulokensis]|uniref:Integral membrane protein n=1 Tax=Planotetraspora phitsanulokensis TaxID=575192 RepID=A0A8J3U0B4_9ACTN|nr:DMT family transporter [Planotetraspora phitsanulokensis]GII36088.1 hypothetical protein Pph01_10910 [Planotetraspora phitsanulokensis]